MLVDALEDSSYAAINDLSGPESLLNLLERIRRNNADSDLIK